MKFKKGKKKILQVFLEFEFGDSILLKIVLLHVISKNET